MTTVLIDAKNQRVYADKRTTEHYDIDSGLDDSLYLPPKDKSKKVVHTPNGVIVGAGNTKGIKQITNAIVNETYDKVYFTYPIDATVLDITVTGEGLFITEYTFSRRKDARNLLSRFLDPQPKMAYRPVTVTRGYYNEGWLGIGSGGKLAVLMATEMGLTPEEIFNKLPEYDTGTSPNYEGYQLKRGGVHAQIK